MQIRLPPIGVSKELLYEEFFGKAGPLYFTYRKQWSSVGIKGPANTLTNTDLQKEVKISHPTQIIPSNSKMWVMFINLRSLIKGVPHSSRRKEGQTWVPQNIIPFFSHPVPTSQAQATQGNSGPPWGLSSAKLPPETAGLAGYFVATSDMVNALELMLQHCAWPASKNVNVNLRYLGPSFIKQLCACLISCMWLSSVGLNHVFSRDWEAPSWKTSGLLPCKEQPFHIDCNTHLHLWFDRVI